MKQREVFDNKNIRWTCVQAYSGMQEKIAEKAETLFESDEGKVTVVCTPTGGAQTVRLELDTAWEEKMTDESWLKPLQKQELTKQNLQLLLTSIFFILSMLYRL